MKNWFLFALLVASLSIALAKSSSEPWVSNSDREVRSLDEQWGPDAYGYIAKDSNEPGGPVYNWINITQIGNPVSGLADDNFVGPFQIGWTFHYYWYDVSSFTIGSNGWIKFSTAGQLAQPIPQIPNATAPNDIIAPYAADWFFGPADPSACYWWSNNTDTLIVSWVNVTAWAQGGNLGNHNFQLILSGVDSSITFQYGTSTLNDVSNNNISIGIENLTGQIGISNFYSNTGLPADYPPNNTAIKFYYPQTVTFQVHDMGMAGVQNPNSQGIFILTGDTLDAWMRMRNAGNQVEASYTANYAVRQVNNTLITQGDYTGGTIQPAQTQEATFPNLWIPASDGVYRLVGTVTLTGDMFAGNNTLRTEIHSVTLPGELIYDDGTAERTWSWAGGEGGMGMGFVPPVYPCEVISVRGFVGETAGTFQFQILDDSGANGGPGAILWSTTVTGASPNAWASAAVPAGEVVITEGQFFVAWYTTAGSTVSFGIDTSSAQGISRRSWENAGGWAENRLLNEADVMLRATIRQPGQVNNPPEITGATPDPSELDTICFNTTIPFAVLAEDPDGQTLNYQWVHNGNNVGTNSASYSHRFITLNQNTLMCRVCDFEYCDSVIWRPWVRVCSAIEDEPGLLPTEYTIEAFPNPFNPSTTIDFALPQRTEARVVVHNLAGQEVAVLHDGMLSAGVHRVAFDGANLASGTYFAVLKTPSAERITKLLLLK